LWCAYHLASIDPSLDIVVLEASHVGFGASGRNGGWCHAAYPLGYAQLVADHGRGPADRHTAALNESVRDIGRLAADEGIDCDYAPGGILSLARLPFQVEYARAEVEEARSQGFGEDEVRFLDRDEARASLNGSDVLAGTWHAFGAAVQPAKLAHGLAAAAERRGVRIFEQSRATAVGPRRVETVGGSISAKEVVLATEGYTATLPGRSRDVVPLYSHMIATEPLPDEVWATIGLHDRPTFHDYRNALTYGQRTADGRLAFGGRGAPYHWGSAIEDEFDAFTPIHEELVRVLTSLLPQVRDFQVTHRWGGPLGVTRDWRPFVVREDGFAKAGGYVGDGVATAQLAGRTLAHLVAGTGDPITTLPWVGHRSRRWEPEPIRWVGIRSGLRLAKWADRMEERTQRPSRLSAVGNWLRGKRAKIQA
jgi:glycine/D-amino acid oxidase-like deaminating enzyme